MPVASLLQLFKVIGAYDTATMLSESVFAYSIPCIKVRPNVYDLHEADDIAFDRQTG